MLNKDVSILLFNTLIITFWGQIFSVTSSDGRFFCMLILQRKVEYWRRNFSWQTSLLNINIQNTINRLISFMTVTAFQRFKIIILILNYYFVNVIIFLSTPNIIAKEAMIIILYYETESYSMARILDPSCDGCISIPLSIPTILLFHLHSFKYENHQNHILG